LLDPVNKITKLNTHSGHFNNVSAQKCMHKASSPISLIPILRGPTKRCDSLTSTAWSENAESQDKKGTTLCAIVAQGIQGKKASLNMSA